MISCEHCNQQVDETSRRELTSHYWTHRVGGPHLIVKYFHGGVHPVCACGCGEQTKYDKRTQTFSVYLQGHNTWQQRLQYGLLKEGEDKPVVPAPRGTGKRPKPLNPAIYCITNSKTGRQYVGLDSYWPARRNYHLGMLRRNVHGNQHLQSSYNRDGEEAFTFSLLERFENPLEMGKREQHWIDTLDTYHNGYNMTRGGEGTERHESRNERRQRYDAYEKKGRQPLPPASERVITQPHEQSVDQDGNYCCVACGFTTKETEKLIHHFWHKHRVNGPVTILHFLHAGVRPLCKCGCGEETRYSPHNRIYNPFVNGHNRASSVEEEGYKISQPSTTHKIKPLGYYATKGFEKMG